MTAGLPKLLGSYLKNRILVQGLPPRTAGQERGAEVQPPRLLTGSSTRILKYSEELKRGPNAEIGPKDIFEMASNKREGLNAAGHFAYPVLRPMLVPVIHVF
jgi:hypothetical protein